MPRVITGRDVVRQLKADLIGKDSYRGVTFTYSWLANQCGHLSLGFIPTLILHLFLKKSLPPGVAAFRSALYISLAWLLFELYNFLGPLLLKRQSGSKALFVKGSKYVFEPDWKNVAFDTFTDLCFFWFGAFSAALYLSASQTIIIVLAGLFCTLVYPVAYWFLTKMYLQQAGYPYQFRLSQWKGMIDEDGKKTVESFLISSAGKHLFIYGGRGSGKTSLGLGIATELSIQRRACIYTTGMKLYHRFAQTDSTIMKEDNCLWTWRTSSLLMIDDINPGDPVQKDFVLPSDFLSLLSMLPEGGSANADVLAKQQVIWILGNEFETDASRNWKSMLEGLGVLAENILSVNLQCPPEKN